MACWCCSRSAPTRCCRGCSTRDTRYTGVAIGWNLGSVLAGGTAPFVAVWLIERTGSVVAPAWFVMATAAIGLGGIRWIRRTAPAGARSGTD